jgi:hypothetical protein
MVCLKSITGVEIRSTNQDCIYCNFIIETSNLKIFSTGVRGDQVLFPNETNYMLCNIESRLDNRRCRVQLIIENNETKEMTRIELFTITIDDFILADNAVSEIFFPVSGQDETCKLRIVSSVQ